jgi:hypothetical protein
MSDCCSVEHPHTVESPNMHDLPNGSPHWLQWTLPLTEISAKEVAQYCVAPDVYEVAVYDATQEDTDE